MRINARAFTHSQSSVGTVARPVVQADKRWSERIAAAESDRDPLSFDSSIAVRAVVAMSRTQLTSASTDSAGDRVAPHKSTAKIPVRVEVRPG